jgi:glutathione S-transferase
MPAGWCGSQPSLTNILTRHFPRSPCCPSEPIQRAYARIWIKFADSRLYSTTGKLLHSPDQKVQALGVIQLADDLRFLESRALATKQGDGPYWLGSELSLADLAFHPWFEQVTVLERYRNFKMPADCSRLMRWWETIASRDAVRSIAKPQKFYLERNALLLRA